MAATDKDRSLKRQALIFCISQGLVPYMEVPVAEPSQLGKSILLTTDLDVLGLGFDWSGRTKRTLFDCKSSKESPINRGLWAAGLMSHLNLDDSYVIVRRAAAPTHRLNADRQSVYLFDAASFERFSKFYSPLQLGAASYLADFARHEEISRFYGEKSPLFDLYAELVHKAPLQMDSAVGLRRLISKVSNSKGELDPNKRAHLYLICEAIAAMSLYLFDFLSRIVRLVGADFKEDDFEQLARLMIWGGAESYELKTRMRQLVLPYDKQHDLELPAWKEFVRLASTLLVAVSQISSLPLTMRNLAFRIAGEVKEESEEFTRTSLSQPRSRQMIFAINRYLVAATGIPRDFAALIEEAASAVVETPSRLKLSSSI
jgi:hypothetical protein